MSTPSNWLPPAPPENVKAYLLDLGQTAASTGFDIAPKVPDCFALVIDNALTQRECRELLAWAEARARWEPALLNVGGGRQRLHAEVRNSERLIVDDFEVAAKLLERVRPFLEREGVDVVGTRGPSAPGKKVWGSIIDRRITSSPFRMTRMNERLRFLRYGPGQYFKPHYDGTYITPDGREQSLLTFHLYLGENSSENVGGATRFFHNFQKSDLDVEPVQGRILIFQHRWMLHSGEEMKQGIKYTMRSDIMYEEAPDLE